MSCWSLDPDFDESQRAQETEWMSLKEYMDFVDETGMTPLVGVNYNNHEHLDWMSEDESIAKAKKQAEYVVNTRGYKGAFFYIGNEDSVKKYPDRWRKHAMAVKEVDPTIKTIFNANFLNPKALKTIVGSIGIDWVDGAEFHGKWPSGGNDVEPAILNDWLKEVPLVNHMYNYNYRERTKELRDTLKDMGVTKDFILASNEFGLNNKRSLYPGFTRYTLSLINLELAMEMFKSGLDMMAFWDNVGDRGFTRETMLMDKSEGYRMNPVHFGLEILWRSVEMEMFQMDTSDYRLHGFCAKDAKKQICYLLNKNETEQKIRFNKKYPKKTKVDVEVLVDTEDHWGQVLTDNRNMKCGYFNYIIPALSFTTLTINV